MSMVMKFCSLEHVINELVKSRPMLGKGVVGVFLTVLLIPLFAMASTMLINHFMVMPGAPVHVKAAVYYGVSSLVLSVSFVMFLRRMMCLRSSFFVLCGLFASLSWAFVLYWLRVS
jgi:hypothetical protein